ncbi:type I DNA topoisomerase [bacterium]|nr:type I DNA topoisomerase [bacterium]
MAKKLIIVESPTKTKTINRILGNKFKVVASMGHIIDLPKKNFGVKITENDVEPKYTKIPDKKELIKKLKEDISKAEEIYLATDPDREGEAISYFISTLDKSKTYKRVLINEITEFGIKTGVNNPGEINMNLVRSQQARRILDRIVGYKLSPFLWKKLKKGLSAGRVQSVALRLIVEREKEIRKFKSEKYYDVFGIFKEFDKIIFSLAKIDGKKTSIKEEVELKKIMAELQSGDPYKLHEYNKKKKNISAPLPYITSSLQQEASKLYGWSPKKTMKIAQFLYEGIKIGSDFVGLITYMRTDSHRISETALGVCKKYIETAFGVDYLGSRKIKKDKKAQDAHEAIRPTYMKHVPEKIKSSLTPDQIKLYTMIFNRFVASQMKNGINLVENLFIIDPKGKYLFKAINESMFYDGWRKIYNIKIKNKPLALKIKVGNIVNAEKFYYEEKETKPKPRLTPGTLIKNLEDRGIGRPSTYANIVSTLFDRKYVEMGERRVIIPTELGFYVSDILLAGFPDIMDYNFTKKIEEDLDLIEQGKADFKKVIIQYFNIVIGLLEKAKVEIESKKDELLERTGEKCPKCGGDLVKRHGKFGSFIACINYPNCDYTENIVEKSSVKCSECGSPMEVRFGKWGKYLKCTNEKCGRSMPYTEGLKCPKCGGYILEKRSKKGKMYWICENNNPKVEKKCDFLLFSKPLKGKCSECGGIILMKYGKKFKCSLCGNIQDDLK